MQGIPSVINEIELMAGLIKARTVVIPEKMPTTILNLDLEDRWIERKERNLLNRRYQFHEFK